MGVLIKIQVVLNKVIGDYVLDLQVKCITRTHKTGQKKKTQRTWTTELHRTNTTDDNTRWYNTSDQVNRNSCVNSM